MQIVLDNHNDDWFSCLSSSNNQVIVRARFDRYQQRYLLKLGIYLPLTEHWTEY